MDDDAFRSSPVGSLVRITGWDARYNENYDCSAFIPDPLPTKLHLAQETYLAVTDAAVAVARLDQAAFRLPNPGLLARPAIRQEAVSTSALEGTYAALDDVLEADFLNRNQLTASVAEVHKRPCARRPSAQWRRSTHCTTGEMRR
jgi:hypothetical protein